MKSIKYKKHKSRITFFLTLTVFIGVLLVCTELNAQEKYTVVLDAGHGGKDPGNLGNGYKESKIVLKVALAVGRELHRNSDINVVYTRDKDVFVELHNRAKIANKNKAVLFVSIHCDSYTKQEVHGAGTFVLGLTGNKENLEIAKRENAAILLEDDYKKNYDYDPNSPESLIGLSVLQEENLDESLVLAGLIQNNFVESRRWDRSVKQNNFLVLRETVMPSVLVELGFLTNKAEGYFLNSFEGQQKMAKAIARAIEKYVTQLKLNTIENTGGTSIAKQEDFETAPILVTPKKTKEKPKVTLPEKKVATPPITTPKETVKNSNIKKETSDNNKKTATPIPNKTTEVKKTVVKTVAPKKTITTPKNTPVKKTVVVAPVEKKAEKVVTKKDLPKPKPKEAPITKQTPGKTVVKKTNAKPVIEFKVQVSSSKMYLPTTSHHFKGLERVEIMVIDEYYKYFSGSSTDFQEIKRILKEVRKAGYEDAFVVSFQDGIKIPLQTALKKQ